MTGGSPTGATRLAGVIGSPIRHSLSPVLLNAAFRAADLDWTYVAFDVPDGHAPAALDAMRTLGLGGLSVTMPHKAAVAAAVDDLDPVAELLGAVNCVVPHREPDTGVVTLTGRNTDGAGFLRSLTGAGVDPSGRRVAVVGAGGAARAIVVALVGAGADVVVVNRTRARADEVVAVATRARSGVGSVPSGSVSAGSASDVAGADIVVNATSVGMADTPQAGASPVDAAALRADQVVADIVYHPRTTPLLAAAAAAGAIAVGGLGMLVHQAAVAFEAWTGVDAPVAAMFAAVEGHEPGPARHGMAVG